MSAASRRRWLQSVLKELGMNEAEYREYLQTPAGQKWAELYRAKERAKELARRWRYLLLRPDAVLVNDPNDPQMGESPSLPNDGVDAVSDRLRNRLRARPVLYLLNEVVEAAASAGP